MTSSSTRSSRDKRPARSLRRAASPAAPRGVSEAVEEVRAVDDSRARRDAGARSALRPRSDTWFAALYVLGLGAWLIAARPTDVSIAVLFACVAAHAVAHSIEFEIGPGSVLPTT